LKRVGLLQALYVNSFPSQSLEFLEVDYDKDIFADILAKIPKIDVKIAAVAPERPVADISKTDLCILRLIIHESLTGDTPEKVLIDEGVELAKEFGGEHSFAFVNAILEKVLLADKSADLD
jgi:N utilization substance protein B